MNTKKLILAALLMIASSANAQKYVGAIYHCFLSMKK